ncbi:MAG: hypothetical protein A2Y31_11400 [Spirochaetes bacterium GWC2_52_13]|nr:MAG: hypothetical protein A2Y31_11400 [Spirochaetes bacterium GWC2_52_13]HCG63795.1 hypothetical protein [Sphaerochaeta sp.]
MRHPLDYDLYIFDMGNVVIRDITTLEAIARHYGFDFDELHDDYSHYAFPLMDGTIDSALYWNHVEHQLGIRVSGDPLVEFFRPRWNPPVVEILEALRAKGKRVVCGSNTYAPHWEWLRQHGFLHVFDALYASHEMGISKPSKRFFTHIMEKEQVAIPKVFFVDDYEENIVAAKAIGIESYHYSFDEGLPNIFSAIFT